MKWYNVLVKLPKENIGRIILIKFDDYTPEIYKVAFSKEDNRKYLERLTDNNNRGNTTTGIVELLSDTTFDPTRFRHDRCYQWSYISKNEMMAYL